LKSTALYFPIAEIRAAFPALARRYDGKPVVRLDNPAGTQVPASVAEAAARCLTDSNSNVGGYFAPSVDATRVVADARSAMADFLGAASANEIVIGPSMTALTFAMSRSIGRDLAPGDEIIVTAMDHDANISPWLTIARDKGARITLLPFDPDTCRIDPDTFEAALSEKTKIVALGYASNVTGSVNDVAELIRRARKTGALTYVDAVQYAPHHPIDVQKLDCDFLACSAYKFFGPHLGILWGRESLLARLQADKVRPASEDGPSKFERGTPQIELMAALTASVDYFAWIGSLLGVDGSRRAKIVAAFEAASAWETALVTRLIDGLLPTDGVRIYGITERTGFAGRVPTVSFTHATRSADDIAEALAARGICVWSGNHYAPETMKLLGIEADSTLRIGIAHYNTHEEINIVLGALAAIFNGDT
jgi:cysteine desulfurase family protein (TIGR01976 family)